MKIKRVERSLLSAMTDQISPVSGGFVQTNYSLLKIKRFGSSCEIRFVISNARITEKKTAKTGMGLKVSGK